jgi:hypothetical protein
MELVNYVCVYIHVTLHQFFVRKPLGNRQFGRPRMRWKDLDLREISCESRWWIQLARECAILNPRVLLP